MEIIISNKEKIAPKKPKSEDCYLEGMGWRGGYSFRQFLGNVYAHLGDVSKIDGIQQLCHHYYLQNGSLNAKTTATRIKKLLGL